MGQYSLRSRLGLCLAATSALASLAAAQCSREKLLAATDTYVAAQTAGKLDGLKLASNFTYQENNKVIDVSKGVLSKALKIDYNRSTADSVACASYTELVARTPQPWVLATQIRYNPDMSIKMIDSIAATTGALFFNATATLGYFQKARAGP